MHEKNRITGADTIIVGSSHAMNGIIEEKLTNTWFFCISSQDILYDLAQIKEVLSGKGYYKEMSD